MRRGKWTALPAALLCVALAQVMSSCGPLTDASWLRILQFTAANSTSGTSSPPITSLDSSIFVSGTDTPAQADFVNVVLQNQSTILGSNATSGNQSAGITVYRAHVSYDAPGLTLPNYDYPATLYIPSSVAAVGTASTSSSGSVGTLLNLPLVPHDLKGWLHENVASSIRESGFRATATVTIQGRTDQGHEADARGGLVVFFVNDASTALSKSARGSLEGEFR